MLDKLNQFRDVIQFGLLFVAGFIWMQSNFVSAADWKAAQINDYEDKIYSLTVKENSLKAKGQELQPWEKADLENYKSRLKALQSGN